MPGLARSPEPEDIDLLIPERPWGLWIRTSSQNAYFLDFISWGRAQAMPWLEWRTVTFNPDLQALTWLSGAHCSLDYLRNECLITGRLKTIYVTKLSTSDMLFRPLYTFTRSQLDSIDQSSSADISACLGVSQKTMRAIEQEYAAPTPLLHHRLLDLLE